MLSFFHWYCEGLLNYLFCQIHVLFIFKCFHLPERSIGSVCRFSSQMPAAARAVVQARSVKHRLGLQVAVEVAMEVAVALEQWRSASAVLAFRRLRESSGLQLKLTL